MTFLGRPKGSLNQSTLAKNKKQEELKYTCMCCGKTNIPEKDFYPSNSTKMWNFSNHRPLFCKKCIDGIFLDYKEKYGEKKALLAICAYLDLPYSEELYKKIIQKNSTFEIGMYTRYLNLGKSVSKPSFVNSILDNDISIEDDEPKRLRWTKTELQNKQEVISLTGSDPFEFYDDNTRKYLFSELIKYFDDDIADDPYKLSQIIQIVNNNQQIRNYDVIISQLNPKNPTQAEEIKTLNSLKKELVANNDKIAKENEISVKNRSNKDIGKSTLTYLMRSLREKDFQKAEENYYDQLCSEGTLWSIKMSNKALLDHAMFDENDRREMFEIQRTKIQDLQKQVDDLMEEKRLLLKENIALKSEGDKQ